MPPPGWQPPPAAPAAVAQPRLNPNEERWEHKRSTGAVERARGLHGAAAQLMVGPADLPRGTPNLQHRCRDLRESIPDFDR